MDLARNILIEVEEKSKDIGIVDVVFDGYEPDVISYHIMQLNQGGLISAIDCTTQFGLKWRATGLTWEGHEFLDAIRNDTVWKSVKDTVKEKGGAVPFEILKTLAVEAAKTFWKVVSGA